MIYIREMQIPYMKGFRIILFPLIFTVALALRITKLSIEYFWLACPGIV